MQQLNKWLLCLLVVAAVAGFSAARTTAPAQQQGGGVQAKPEKIGGGKKAAALSPKGRGKRFEALKKVVPTLKTSLVEAVTLAEKELGGKTVDVSLEIVQEKPIFQINMLMGDKFGLVTVDPETKKVTRVTKDEPVAEPAAEGGEGAKEGGY